MYLFFLDGGSEWRVKLMLNVTDQLQVVEEVDEFLKSTFIRSCCVCAKCCVGNSSRRIMDGNKKNYVIDNEKKKISFRAEQE